MTDHPLTAIAPVAPSRPRSPGAMALIYDDTCPFCVRCAAWVARQPALLPLHVLPASAPATRAAHGHVPGYGDEVTVVADDGRVWSGPGAFVAVLWCLAAYRSLTPSLTGPAARALFERVSASRGALGRALGGPDCGPQGCGR